MVPLFDFSKSGIDATANVAVFYWRNGEMAERSNAAVLKTVILYPRNRGFESLFLRQSKSIPQLLAVGFLFLAGRVRLA
jgi:hypothetical protein